MTDDIYNDIYNDIRDIIGRYDAADPNSNYYDTDRIVDDLRDTLAKYDNLATK